MSIRRRFFVLLLALLTLAGVCACAKEPEAAPYEPRLNAVMPTIHINTEDGSYDFIKNPVREDKMAGTIQYVGATVAVSDCDAQYVISSADAQVKARGNWTLNYPKKPIRIKFAEKQGMLGLNEGRQFKNWLLLADWKDLSMSNNTAALFLAQSILGADGYYVSDFTNVEVYINGGYWGVYLLAEQQEINDGRSSAAECEKGYTGTDIGYMFEYDAYYRDERNMPDGGDPTFDIDYGLYNAGGKVGRPHPDPYQAGGLHGFTLKSDINDQAQLDFISSYVQNAYDIITRAIYKDEHYAFNEDYTAIVPVEGKSVQDTVGAVVDLRSAVDMYIMNEIVCNPDIAWSSFYFTLDMSENGSRKLIYEAPWDYDSCFGMRASTPTTPGTETNEGLYVSRTSNPWLRVFSDQQWFMDMVAARWQEITAQGIPEKTIELIETQKVMYEDNYAANYSRWKTRVWDGNEEVVPELNTYHKQSQAADFLIRWLTGRFAYLDSQWLPAEA